MKWTPLDPPRTFGTGRGDPIEIKDFGRIALDPNEQVTFVTEAGAEYDVTRKSWGFYATPSLNGRLLNFGLRAALVRSYVNKYYVFLIERGREAEVEAYLAKENNQLVRWLDNDDDLREAGGGSTESAQSLSLHCPCGGDRFTSVHMYFSPPEGEVRYSFSNDQYRRELFRCSLCGHFVSVHDMDTKDLYEGDYVDATYGDAEGIRAAFERVVSLPPERSDNAGRVRRVLEFAETWFDPGPRTALDVGAGLCVFLHLLAKAGWDCTALDPDERAVEHARKVVGVNAVCADFESAPDLGQFDLISFNKVLEHVRDPIAMLKRGTELVKPGGIIYVELPDGEAAAPPSGEGYGREEFFVEHHHVFSLASTSILAERAGLEAVSIERLREPSSKYTLRAFLRSTAAHKGNS